MLRSGLFFQRYADERALVHTTPQRGMLAALLLALFALPVLVGGSVLGIATMAGITLIAVFGLQVTIGLAGQLNLGQSAFVGVGAFVAAALATRGFGIWVCLPAAAFASGAVSIVFGLPAARIKGFYLVLTTIAAQIMFPIVIGRLPANWFGGNAGLPVDPPVIFGAAIDTPVRMYELVLVVAIVAYLATRNLARCRTGRALQAMRDNDIASSVMGINLAYYKMLAFFAGAFLAGISGCLLAYYVRYVSTEQFTLWLSVWYVGMLIVGGMRSSLGAILGVVSLTLLDEGVRALGNLVVASTGASGGVVLALSNMALGAVIVAILIFEPLGLEHRWERIKLGYRLWPYPRKG
ncbi:MAG: branched-chain amino acid ABC transporter permease [Rubrivivax sp.]